MRNGIHLTTATAITSVVVAVSEFLMTGDWHLLWSAATGLFAGGLYLAVVYWIGPRFRMSMLSWWLLYGARKTLERAPGRGDIAVKLIARAPSFETAACIFNGFVIADRRIDSHGVITTMAYRIRKENLTQEVMSFLKGKGIKEFPDEQLKDKFYARPHKITKEEQEEWNYQYEWMIAKFESSFEGLRDA